MMSDLQSQMKEAVAQAAVDLIEDGMVLGLGSGSTAALMIEALGAKLSSGKLREIIGVTTSFQGEVLASKLGIPLKTLSAVDRIDLAIDGADEKVISDPQSLLEKVDHSEIGVPLSLEIIRNSLELSLSIKPEALPGLS